MISPGRLTFSFSKLFYNKIKRDLTSKVAVATEQFEETSKGKNILISKTGPITLFGINRVSKKNSLDRETAEELSEALDVFDQNKESSVGIIHGVGGNFCAGFDLEEISKCETDTDSLPHFGSLSSRNVLTKKPLIASVSGYAVGVGFELALMCDLRVIEEQARMGFLNRRFGIPIMCGGTVRLPAIVGYSRAMDMIISGREITGEEAFQWGIANRLVTCGGALGQSVTLAQSIIKYPQRALLSDRTSLHFASLGAKSIEEALEFEKDNSTDILLEEGIEGAKKFAQGFGRHGKAYNITQLDRTSFRELSDDLL
ncbi:2,3-dehydroadipyl-CoA hydratase-like [Microplitis mediator]|uniref:2,3-dehydroadipyl-CoA hydratase-like n=1 Tax=Microplitis mediator TaxID=375433 RepID=UPI00255304C9|nr:2,3-dehydroadipyl-CoA hydratase-like [Microplitis mediator]